MVRDTEWWWGLNTEWFWILGAGWRGTLELSPTPHFPPRPPPAVLPDFERWGNNYVLAHFDNDPAQEVNELAKLPDPDLRRKVTCAGCMGARACVCFACVCGCVRVWGCVGVGVGVGVWVGGWVWGWVWVWVWVCH